MPVRGDPAPCLSGAIRRQGFDGRAQVDSHDRNPEPLDAVQPADPPAVDPAVDRLVVVVQIHRAVGSGHQVAPKVVTGGAGQCVPAGGVVGPTGQIVGA